MSDEPLCYFQFNDSSKTVIILNTIAVISVAERPSGILRILFTVPTQMGPPNVAEQLIYYPTNEEGSTRRAEDKRAFLAQISEYVRSVNNG